MESQILTDPGRAWENRGPERNVHQHSCGSEHKVSGFHIG